MMKKLLVVILLFSIASSANALTVTLDPNGLVAGPAGSYDVNVVSDSELSYEYYLVITDNTYGDIGSITIQPAAGDDASVTNVGFGLNYDSIWSVEALDVAQPFTTAPGNQFQVSVNYTGAGLGQAVTIELVDGDLSVLDSVTFCSQACEAAVGDYIDLTDLTAFAAQWLADDCQVANCWCEGADLNTDTNVDLIDSAFLAGYWLDVYSPRPAIELSERQFLFETPEGGPDPADKTLTIRNSGGRTLNWVISYDDCDWLTVEPNSGSSTGEANDVTLSVDTTGLTESYYYCELTISDPAAENNPQIVEVTLYTDIECFDSNHPDYDDWVSFSKPKCWCYKYHCNGDGDGSINGSPFTGFSRVHNEDLNILIKSWKRLTSDPDFDICGDFGRDWSGPISMIRRVNETDLAILMMKWKTGPISGDPNCGGDIDLSNP
jgi:hypothetical protein